METFKKFLFLPIKLFWDVQKSDKLSDTFIAFFKFMACLLLYYYAISIVFILIWGIFYAN